MKFDNKSIGTIGENIAAEYLKNHNYKILERNFSCKIGEIDIIAKNENNICFIEVKSRTSDYFGMPSEAVNYYKEQKICKVAQYYILKKDLHKYNLRFDVVEIIFSSTTSKLNLIKNAFIIDGYI
ncbi:YraN family protein [Clostridium ihumii]|uniref:YraN family protein n=1 Tax=Clostridium ihumii TaxID=1470356 RepID=UPI00055945B3|nr:YraN family protein [Clostridium ihumii]